MQIFFFKEQFPGRIGFNKMFLSKHSNGRYYIYYFLSSGKRKTKSTGERTKKEAIRFLIKFRDDLREKEQQKFTPITLREFQFHYFRYAESVFTVKTCSSCKTTFNFLIRYFGNIQLSELTTKNLEEYLYIRRRDRSVYAARKDYAYLSAAFNKAIRDGFLLENPTKGISRPRTPEKQPLFYSKEEFERLINCIDNEDMRDLTLFAVNTGLRQMELILLEWRQINFENKLLTLDNQSHITKGKRIRSVPLNDISYSILVKRFKNRSTKFENVFTWDDRKITQSYHTHYFKQYVIKAGLNRKYCFHTLRHTFASRLVQKGVSIYVVSKLLGHRDIKTTMIYSHLRGEDLMQAVNVLNDI
jgi:integrase